MAPTYNQSGTGNTTTGDTLSVPYPVSGLANLDIAIIATIIRNATDLPITIPGDWDTVVDARVGAMNVSWSWKRLDGTETGNVTITGGPGGGIGFCGRMYVYRGCIATGDPYEDNTVSSGAVVTTYSSAAIDTTGADRLAVCLVQITDDDKTYSGMTGSNVTWTLNAQFASASGLDQTLIAQSAPVASALSVTAGSETYAGAEEWQNYTFALLPEASSTEASAAWVTTL